MFWMSQLPIFSKKLSKSGGALFFATQNAEISSRARTRQRGEAGSWVLDLALAHRIENDDTA
jgi:hypothetical protein